MATIQEEKNNDDNAKRGRSVRFPPSDDNLCSYHDEAAVMDQIESRRDVWYQHADLTHIKRKAMMVSREAHRYGFGSLLTNTYGNPGNSETQEVLNTWARNANSRRGLERWINDEYSAKRSDIRRRTIQSVLRAQEKMRQEGIEDPEYQIKVISRLSEAFSQDSRKFARSMGVADEEAVKADDAASVSSVASSQRTDKIGESLSAAAPRTTRSPSPRSVVMQTRPPRKSLGLQGAGDFRNFV